MGEVQQIGRVVLLPGLSIILQIYALMNYLSVLSLKGYQDEAAQEAECVGFESNNWHHEMITKTLISI